jgi:hypothetical protein
VPNTKARVLAGVTLAALAAAGVAAVVSYRQGQRPHPDERAHLDELDVRLHEAQELDKQVPQNPARRVVDSLQRNQGISAARLRQWITGLRHGTLSPEQTTVAESDFDALEREADEGGA